MVRKAFLLGFYSIGGQVLLLRELVVSFNGDELFIGTALFGWLVSVALGAGLGGRGKPRISIWWLFGIGAGLLPPVIAALRLLPLMIIETPGEFISFMTGVWLSMVAMLPVGVVSGWLFTRIARESHRPSESIIEVYLFEGVGAFAGGIIVTIMVGWIFSTMGMALAVAGVTAAFFAWSGRRWRLVMVLPALILAIGGPSLGIRLDDYLGGLRYHPIEIAATVDTHYGRQTILRRGESYALMTDNVIEAVSPDRAAAENALISGLVYRPEAERILYIGRVEFGVGRLAAGLPDVSLVSLDPRAELDDIIDEVIPGEDNVAEITDDQISYFRQAAAVSRYDVIVLNAGEPDSYKNSRLMTVEYFGLIRSHLDPEGILVLPTGYDTDRYISPSKKKVLAVIRNTLQGVFGHVVVWPGETTVFFAADYPIEEIPADSLYACIGRLGSDYRYINKDYLADRLDPLKMDRLNRALAFTDEINRVERPILTHYQAVYRSQHDSLDRRVVPWMIGQPMLPVALGVLIVALGIFLGSRRYRFRIFGLFLYFTAGFVSLSFELLSFYMYQSLRGSLYSEMALLIGVFMLGLAAGTYYSNRIDSDKLEYPALFLMFTAVILFIFSYEKIPGGGVMLYYLLFLFTISMATGSLFVAATRRYYYARGDVNRGTGYALELVGSSLGALLTVTILLPILGLSWLVLAMALLIALAFIGAIATSS